MKDEANDSKQTNDILAKLDRLNDRLEVPYSRSKADVWAAMETQLETKAPAKTIKLIHRPMFRLAMAASVLLVVGLIGLMRFYAVEVSTIPGQQLVVDLPDGSTAQLNAVSVVTYHPYWWRFSRILDFEGEAFFEVENGNRFSVHSSNGSTTVLGTSFNIYSRDENYRVACLTGTVRVNENKGDSLAILTPNEKAELKKSGGFEVIKDINFKDEAAWVDDEFYFYNRPLKDVLREVEVQYGVVIKGKDVIDGERIYQMTGRLIRSETSVEDILQIICRTFGELNFRQAKDKEYVILKEE